VPSSKDFVLVTTVCPVTLRLASLCRMRLTCERGGRVIWDYLGLRREIPREVVENAAQLAEDYDSRTPAPTLDSAPKHASLMWEQTVPLQEKTGQLGGSKPQAAADDH